MMTEVSPAKSLEIVPDSEGEEEFVDVTTIMDPTPAPRPRPRPRMRPVPPPDDPDDVVGNRLALGIPPTDNVPPFGNSAVRDVPQSLPPSSLPAQDSFSVPQPPALPTGNAVNEAPQTTTSHSPAPPANPSMRIRIKPKMRPPPPPEPDTGAPGTSTTAPSVAATDSSANLNPSTSATSNSAGSARRPSALDDAQEFTGRGARRLVQLSKSKHDEIIDVGGPQDEVINLMDSSDAERPTKKPKPKPKKKTAKTTAASATTSSAAPSDSKRRSPQAPTSDDELGRWDIPIPAPSGKKRKKAILPDPTEAVPAVVATSSPLSSPAHSPAAKRRRDPSPVVDESPPKKPRKSAGTMEIVLRAPAVQGEKSKGPRGKGKPVGLNDEEVAPGPVETANEPDAPSIAMDIDTGPAEPAPTGKKKSTKKKPAKGKKGSAASEAPAEGTEAAPTAKKPARGKGKGKAAAKEAEPTPNLDEGTPPVASTSSNPNAVASSSGPSPPDAGSSNPSAVRQTPAPKPSRPKPRHSTTPAPMPVLMGASGALLTTGRKGSDRPLSEMLRLSGGIGSPSPRMGLSRRGSSKIAPLLAVRKPPPPPPPPMPKKPVRKKKGQSDQEDSEEGSEWEKLTDKQKEKKRREKEVAGWYSD